MVNAHQYGQVKSVLLRESDCNPTDIMDLINMFPAMEVLFVETRHKTSLYSQQKAKQARIKQTNADQSAKRYLSSNFEKLQKLNKLAYIPHSNDSRLRGGTGDFLGPARLLSLKNLCNLTSLSILISAFTSPNGPNTGRLTVSPMEVLPRSLRSLHIIAGDHTSKAVLGDTPAHRAWFQPRAAALGFMEELAGFLPTEFPSLRQLEYIWAVNRLTVSHRCDGSYLSCCDMHSSMQALSPDMDYTSKFEGIVSPFKTRFDSLELALNSVGVTFKAVEVRNYSDFFNHWQQGRK